MTSPIDRFFDWLFALFPVRVMLHFGGKTGYVLAAGLAYQALFALFAALWAGFAVAGLALSGSPSLRNSLFTVINQSVPGLIKTSGGAGAIDATQLLHAGVFGVTGIVALGVLLFTAIGFLGSARGAVRVIFDVPQPTTIFWILKAKDLGLGLVFGLAVVMSSALSLLSTSSVRFLLGTVGISAGTVPATLLLRLVGLVIVFVFDAVVLVGLFRVLAGLHIPTRTLVQASLFGAAALGILKAVGGVLLGRGTTNPLLASFTVIVALLIFLNLVCQVLLLVASYIAVRMLDQGVLADPVAERARVQRLKDERLAEIARRAAAARPLRVRLWRGVRSRLPERFRR